MNRRELLAGVSTAIAASTGVNVECEAVDADRPPLFIKIRFPRGNFLSTKACMIIKQTVKSEFRGSPLGHVPVLLCEDGVDITVETGHSKSESNGESLRA